MKLNPNLQIVLNPIGTLPQAVAPHEPSENVVRAEFGVSATMPLRGSVPLSEYIDGLEAEDAMALHLRDARKSLNSVLGVHPSLRKLRLAAGLSQAKLAVAAKTTQSYIARVESGSLDPGTDMVSRIAHAIDVTDVEVFVAIRNQRGEDT